MTSEARVVAHWLLTLPRDQALAKYSELCGKAARLPHGAEKSYRMDWNARLATLLREGGLWDERKK